METLHQDGQCGNSDAVALALLVTAVPWFGLHRYAWAASKKRNIPIRKTSSSKGNALVSCHVPTFRSSSRNSTASTGEQPSVPRTEATAPGTAWSTK